MAASNSRHIALAPGQSLPPVLTAAAGSLMTLDSPTARLAWKFYAHRTDANDAVDVSVAVTGTVTGHTYTLEIQADSSDAPSGTPLGAATSAFAGPAASGFVGLKTLGSDTGNLTINSPYWVVMKCASGTPDGSNFVQARTASSNALNREKLRKFNGTNWTAVAAVSAAGLIVRRTTTGGYTGYPITGSQTNASAATDIFGTNRQGIRYRFAGDAALWGVAFRITKSGAPGDLVVSVYQSDSLLGSVTLVAADITSNIDAMAFFGQSGLTVAAGTDVLITFKQLTNGGSDAADYDLRTYPVDSSYISTLVATNHRMVWGTGDTPSTYADITTNVALVWPLLGNPEADFSTGSGGSNVFVLGDL